MPRSLTYELLSTTRVVLDCQGSSVDLRGEKEANVARREFRVGSIHDHFVMIQTRRRVPNPWRVLVFALTPDGMNPNGYARASAHPNSQSTIDSYLLCGVWFRRCGSQRV